MKNITVSDNTLEIRNSFWKLSIPLSSIEEAHLYTAVATLSITFKEKAPFKVSPIPSLVFMCAWSEMKLVYTPAKRTLSVNLSEGQKMKADGYYAGIESLKKSVPSLMVHETGIGGTQANLVLNASSDNTYTCPCYKCDTEFTYTPTTQYPYLVKCPSCTTLNYNAECPTCNLGGFVVPKAYFKQPKAIINVAKSLSLDWRAVSETPFEEKPTTWLCPQCQNTWKIPKQVYEEPVIEGKPAPKN